MIPFVVLGLPRSNTYWLSQFLSTPGRDCEHDPSRRWRSRAEIAPYFGRRGAAAVDTALGLIWPEVAVRGVRVVVIHRPVVEVRRSLEELGIDSSGMADYARRLWQIDGLHFNVSDLDEQYKAAQLYEFCLDQPCDRERWKRMRRLRLECNPEQIMREAQSNLDGIRAVFLGEEAA